MTPWTAAYQASLSITISRSLLKLRSIKSVMPSNHLILCRPIVLLPSIFPSIRVFSNESACHIRWPKDWHFSITLSKEYSGLISFRIEWLDLVVVVVQGILKRPPQYCKLISLQLRWINWFKKKRRIFSNTTVQKHQFFCTQLSLWSNSHIHTDCWKNRTFAYTDVGRESHISAF